MNPLGVDKVYILSLDKRSDLWLSLRRDCEQRGWDVENFIVGKGDLFAGFFPYGHKDVRDERADSWTFGNCESRHNHFNALLSHRKIIQKAKDAGYKSILMMEDDCYFTSRFDEVIAIIKPQIERLDWDIILLGYWIGEHVDDMHAGNNLIVEHEWNTYKLAGVKKIDQNGAGGWHGAIISERLYDMALGFPLTMPLDCQFNARGHQKFKSFFVYPKCLHVHSTWSYCEDRFVSRDLI